MFAQIRHLASHTERYDTMAKFYQTIFGMKQITTGLMDENSKANAERGVFQGLRHRHDSASITLR